MATPTTSTYFAVLYSPTTTHKSLTIKHDANAMAKDMGGLTEEKLNTDYTK